MMWLKRPEDGKAPEGVTKPFCYHIHQFEQLVRCSSTSSSTARPSGST